MFEGETSRIHPWCEGALGASPYSDAPWPPVPFFLAPPEGAGGLLTMRREADFGIERLAKIDASAATSDCPPKRSQFEFGGSPLLGRI